MDINELVQQINIADQFDKKELQDIGYEVVEGYETDEESRADWLQSQVDALKLAVQIKEVKSYPWQNAANVKFPLLTIASLQFQARSYQVLVPDYNIVKVRVVGADPDNSKTDRANRVGQYMSYQLLEEIENWEEDTDKLCLLLPICGTVFRKVYFDGQKPRIDMVLPQDLVVNYYAKDLESAPRITQELSLFQNDIISKMRSGEFVNNEKLLQPYEDSDEDDKNEVLDKQGIKKPSHDDDETSVPIDFIEQCCWYDFDGDGYCEPYVITVHKGNKTVAKISPNYRPDGVIRNDKNEIVSIKPTNYYVNYTFVPNPVSGIYGIGFGMLLGPINEACNTLINQLIDAGTLANLPSGFLGRGIRIQGGNYNFRPGEFKFVQNTGDDLRKNIFQFQFQTPSNVLFQLLNILIGASQNIASVTDTMMGEQPGQNTPFSTTQEVLNQGLKVYSSIIKRIHRSLKKELKKLFNVNKYYVSAKQEFAIVGNPASQTNEGSYVDQSDFEGDASTIIPASDPNIVSDLQKMQQSNVVMGMVQMGTVNPQEATRRVLEAQRIPDIPKLMQMPPPQPNFDQQIELEKLKLEAKKHQDNVKIDQYAAAADAAEKEAKATLEKAQATVAQANLDLAQAKFDFEKQIFDAQKQMADLQMQLQHEKNSHALTKAKNDIVQTVTKEAANQEVKRAKAANKAKPSSNE